MFRSKSPAAVPANVDADPAVIAANTRHGELVAQLNELQAKFDGVNGSVANESQSSNLDAAARKMVAGDFKPATSKEAALRQRDDISADMAVLRRAIELIAADRDQDRAEASKRIAESRKPEYVEIVKRMKTAIESLQAAIAEENDFRARADRDGVSIGVVMRPMWIAPGIFAGWLTDAKEHYGLA
jgi:hypothetical protein